MPTAGWRTIHARPSANSLPRRPISSRARTSTHAFAITRPHSRLIVSIAAGRWSNRGGQRMKWAARAAMAGLGALVLAPAALGQQIPAAPQAAQTPDQAGVRAFD